MPKPVVQPLDQTTQSALVTNVYAGAELVLSVNNAGIAKATADHLELVWNRATNNHFGNLDDGSHTLVSGRFTASSHDEILFYFSGDGHWWLGTSDGSRFTWSLVGVSLFGNLNDGLHAVWTGNFTGQGRTEVLFYYSGDERWWLGTVDPSGAVLTWTNVDTTNFGNLLDGDHTIWIGDFTGEGRDQVLFYFDGDGHFFRGRVDNQGSKLDWGNGPIATNLFGNLNDGDHEWWLGQFSAAARTQILFYFSGDNNWWFGDFHGGTLNWSKVAQTAFGNLLDGDHLFWAGNFTGGSDRAQLLFYYHVDGHFFLGRVNDNGDTLAWTGPLSTNLFGDLTDAQHAVWQGTFSALGKQEILFHFNIDNRWWLGTVAGNGSNMTWSQVAQTAFGNLLDGRHAFFQGDFEGARSDQITFLYADDGNWWTARVEGGQLDWYRPANTRGFGDLLDGSHKFFQGDFEGVGKQQLLFYDRDDGDFFLGLFDGVRIPLPHGLEPGDEVVATEVFLDRFGHSDAVTVDHNFAMQHYDRARTGWNFRETRFTPNTVRDPGLRRLFKLPTDDQFYAQPLYVKNVRRPGEKQLRNIVYVATESDSVYAFDADTGQQLWQTRLLPPGQSPVPSIACYGSGPQNIAPWIGITGTPVVDRPSATLFAVAKTYDGSYHQYIYALDLADGSIRPDTPCEITFSRAGIDFDARANNNRAALLLSQDILHIAWGSHGDKHSDKYHGWVASYDAPTLNLQHVFDAGAQGQCGIWQSGIGLAADEDGNIYFTTGNAPQGAGFVKYGNCVVKLRPNLQASDYFSPVGQDDINTKDWDLGSGGVLLLPPQRRDSTPTHLLVTGGKQGYLYLLDRDAMGHEENLPDNRRFVLYGTPLYLQDYVAEVGAQPAGIDSKQPGMFGGPSYYSDNQDGQFLYFVGQRGPNQDLGQLVRFQLDNAQLTPIAKTDNGFSGSTPAVTSDHSITGSAIVWALDRDEHLQLFAYDANALGPPLLSVVVGIWANSQGQAFIQPTIIDGKVFAPTSDGLVVYSV